MRRLLTLLFLTVATLVGLVAVMLLFERQLIYFPERTFDVLPESLGLSHEDVALTAEDGVAIHAWLLPVRDAPFTVLLCHGNAGNISHRLHRALVMQEELGTSVLLFDYRGYGRSAGQPDEQGTYRDARAAYRWLVETKGVDPRRLVVSGESLGAAVAAQLGTEKPMAALVLESPFTSIPEMARAAYPFLPPLGPLIRTRYDTLSKAPRLALPLLVLHGERDEIVPLAQGRRVFDAAPGPKWMFVIPGASHNDTYVTGGRAYWQSWRDLLGRL